MPIGRHWKQLRPYDDCFVATEAVDWLLEFLQQHHDSGREITRSQVIKLLQKFHRTNYIEDVRGVKFASEEFEDNNRLFRFLALSPMKTPQWPKQGVPMRQALNSRTNLATTNPGMDKKPNDDKIKTKLWNNNHPPPPNMNNVQPRKHAPRNHDSIWKNMILESLSQTLLLENITDLVDVKKICHVDVKHNMTILHRSGYVTGVNKADLPPPWIISAMRYLAKWPEKSDDEFPQYPGFEKDVFIMIREYFDTCPEPLTTFALYPILTSIFSLITDNCHPSPIKNPRTHVLHVSDTTPERWRRSSFNLAQANSCANVNQPLYPERHSNGHHQPAFDEVSVEDSSSYRGSYHSQNGGERCYQPYYNRNMSRQYCHSVDSSSPPSYDSAMRSSRYYSTNSNNCNNNDNEEAYRVNNRNNNHTGPQYYQTQPTHPSIQRAASLSHLLAGPRVETAFVGDQTHTVYYGMQRNSKVNLVRARSTNHVDRQPMDHEPTYGLIRRSNLQEISKSSHDLYSKSTASLYHSASSQQQYSSNRKSPTQPPSKLGRWASSKRNVQNARPKSSMHELRVDTDVTHNNLYRAPSNPHIERNSQIYRPQDVGSIKLRMHSTPAEEVKQRSPESLFGDMRDERLIKAFQLILLFVPPSNRRVLHMTLKLMHKASNNYDLVLDEQQTTRRLVFSSLWRSIVRSRKEADLNEVKAIQIVEFLVDNYEQVMAVPFDLRAEIEKRIHQLQTEAKQSMQKKAPGSSISAKAVERLGLDQQTVRSQGFHVYCQQVTTEQYESNKQKVSQGAMAELLENIIHDQRMSTKEKNKKLKQFQRAYPEIYAERFPTTEVLKQVLAAQESKAPKIKAPLLSRPMGLLRKLR